MSTPGPQPVPYIAQIHNVKEVILHGTARLDFWQAILKQVSLQPLAKDGKAVVVLSATQLAWSGIPFRELTISVAATHPTSPGEDYYLVQAFNSNHILSLAERIFFQTPYLHAPIQLKPDPPTCFSVGDPLSPFAKAEMSASSTCLCREPQNWQGRIFLPAPQAGHFYAQLGGLTQVYPFSPAEDHLEIEPFQGVPVFQWLKESDFTPAEWHIRTEGSHARSKTERILLK